MSIGNAVNGPDRAPYLAKAGGQLSGDLAFDDTLGIETDKTVGDSLVIKGYNTTTLAYEPMATATAGDPVTFDLNPNTTIGGDYIYRSGGSVLPVVDGGTGASTPAGARTNLSAAQSGANSDITSLSALSTPLSILQGGTGATNSTTARTNLVAAASGANSDITSLSGLVTPLSGTQGGTGVNNGVKTITLGGNLTTSGAFNTIFTVTGNTNVTFPTSGTLLTSTGSTSITTLGTVTIGTWHATIIEPTYGGTGINNGSNTITLGGNLTTSGSFTTTLTVTGNTAITLPTSGTLITLPGSTSITTLGTITTGTWNGSVLASQYGGTGINNGTSTINISGNVSTAGGFFLVLNLTGNTNITLPTSGTLLTTPGSTGITTLGTVTTGTWNATIISPTYGGTGINNGVKTITLGGNLTTSGAFNSTFTMTGNTNVTFPTSGTLMASAGSFTPGFFPVANGGGSLTDSVLVQNTNSVMIGANSPINGKFFVATNSGVETNSLGAAGSPAIVISNGAGSGGFRIMGTGESFLQLYTKTSNLGFVLRYNETTKFQIVNDVTGVVGLGISDTGSVSFNQYGAGPITSSSAGVLTANTISTGFIPMSTSTGGLTASQILQTTSGSLITPNPVSIGGTTVLGVLTVEATSTSTFSANSDPLDANRYLTLQNNSSSNNALLYNTFTMGLNPTGSLSGGRIVADFRVVRRTLNQSTFDLYFSGFVQPASYQDYVKLSYDANFFTGKTFMGGQSIASAILHLTAGTSTAGTAPLKLTSGTNLSSAEGGAIEFDGVNLFFTPSATRLNVWTGNSGAAAPGTTGLPTALSYYGTSGATILGIPTSWATVNLSNTSYKIPLYT